MTCIVKRIHGGPQSGKTTILLGTLERLHRQGVPAVYVTPTQQMAADARRRTFVPCVGWNEIAGAYGLPAFICAVALDDSTVLRRSGDLDAAVLAIRYRLELHQGPTLLLIAE